MWRNFFKPEYINWRRAFCLITGVYIYFFIVHFEPHKGDKITYVWASTYDFICHQALNYISTVFFCALATLLLPKRFPTYFLPQNLSFRRFLLLVAVMPFFMGLCYFIINYYYFKFEITLSWFASYMFEVMVINAFFAGLPFVIVYIFIFDYFTNAQSSNQESLPSNIFYDAKSTHNTQEIADEQNSNQKNILNTIFYGNKSTKNVQKTGLETIAEVETTAQTASETPTTDIRHPRADTERPPQYPHDNSTQRPVILSFTDSANKKTLDMPLNHLYYITSAQNYIEIFHRNADVIKSTLLRQSLKTIEENMILSSDSPLIRCHKAFIVNREKVIELRGTAKTAHFILEDIETTIPVSRQKFPEVEAQFLD